jgi:peptide/nickel transport system permease protein
MARTVTSRLLGSASAIFGASVLAFLFLRIVPSNPARLILGAHAPQASVEALYRQMGLNQPLWVQYWRYISAFFRGDWGFSFGNGQPVTTVFRERLPASLELGFYAFLFAFSAAVILALVATYRRRPLVDRFVRMVSYIALGTPAFWFGLLLLLVFSVYLGILPGPEGRLSTNTPPPPSITGFYTIDALLAGQLSTFADALKHLILPAIALAVPAFGYLVRLLRANLLEVAREPFLVVVRSKGLGHWRAFRRHALPNAFLPTLTASSLVFAELLTGSVLVETVFNWPGIGAETVQSILRQDYAVVQAFIFLSALAYVTATLITDLLYGVIDPRVRIPSVVR